MLAYTAYLSRALDIDFDPRMYPDWAAVSNAFGNGQVDVIATRREDQLQGIGPARDFENIGFAVRPEYRRLVPLIDRALRAMPAADKERILQASLVASDPLSSGWSVSAMRLLPVLIAIGVILGVTLRAFVLLQREMARRVETEQRLATQLSFQQTMMEVVPYPLVAKDLENRYIAVNRAFEKMLGIRREDVIGHTALEAQSWGPENSKRLHDLVGQSITNGQREQVEFAFHNRLGELRHALFWTGAFKAA
ncbi:PAS domain S-box protein, partial [Caballeronia sp. M23-90]